MGFDTERRAHPRLPLTAKVTLVDREPPQFCFARDISLGGVLLSGELRLPVGSHLGMEIAIPGRPTIAAKGVVVRQTMDQPANLGVQFTQLSESDMTKLTNYLVAAADGAE